MEGNQRAHRNECDVPVCFYRSFVLRIEISYELVKIRGLYIWIVNQVMELINVKSECGSL